MLAAFHQLYMTYNTTHRARGVDRLEYEILLPDPVNTNLHLFPSVTNAYVNVLCARKAFALISSTAADVHRNALACINAHRKSLALVIHRRALNAHTNLIADVIRVKDVDFGRRLHGSIHGLKDRGSIFKSLECTKKSLSIQRQAIKEAKREVEVARA